LIRKIEYENSLYTILWRFLGAHEYIESCSPTLADSKPSTRLWGEHQWSEDILSSSHM